jgi:two-component system response regulator AtoC
VRQLQNFVERLVVLSDAPRIARSDVDRQLAMQAGALGLAIAEGYGPAATGDSEIIGLEEAIRRAEKRALEKALRKAGGNRNIAARILGVSRRTLYYKLQQHGVR